MNSSSAETIGKHSLSAREQLNYRCLIVAGIVFRLGQGDFFNGIVFPQFLQELDCV